MSVYLIEESPNPGVWNVLQSRGIYKTKERAVLAAVELTRWHTENLTRDCMKFGWRYRAVKYCSLAEVGK